MGFFFIFGSNFCIFVQYCTNFTSFFKTRKHPLYDNGSLNFMTIWASIGFFFLFLLFALCPFIHLVLNWAVFDTKTMWTRFWMQIKVWMNEMLTNVGDSELGWNWEVEGWSCWLKLKKNGWVGGCGAGWQLNHSISPQNHNNNLQNRQYPK